MAGILSIRRKSQINQSINQPINRPRTPVSHFTQTIETKGLKQIGGEYFPA